MNFRFVKLNHHYQLCQAVFQRRYGSSLCLPCSEYSLLHTLSAVAAWPVPAVLATDTGAASLHLVDPGVARKLDSGGSRHLQEWKIGPTPYLIEPKANHNQQFFFFLSKTSHSHSEPGPLLPPNSQGRESSLPSPHPSPPSPRVSSPNTRSRTECHRLITDPPGP